MDVIVNRNKIEDIPKKEYSIEFEVEKTPVRLGKSDRFFYMDFNDTDFPIRLQEARKNISKYLESKKQELGIQEEDVLKPKKYDYKEIKQMLTFKKVLEVYVRSQIDYIFGYPICNDIFGIASVVSVTVKGEYYFDNFLNSILPLVEKEYGIRIKATSEKVKAYLSQKGMHPAYKK